MPGREKPAFTRRFLAPCQQFTDQLHTTDFRPNFSLEQLLPIRSRLGKSTEEPCRQRVTESSRRGNEADGLELRLLTSAATQIVTFLLRLRLKSFRWRWQ